MHSTVNPSFPARSLGRGFTIIELMIVVVIVGVIAGVAYPSFMDQLRKGRRADAVDFAARIQQAQARHRANNPTYAADLAALGIASGTSPGGLYTLATAAGSGTAAATSYTVTATAVTGKSQASDSGCTTMSLTFATGNTTYGEPRCWGR